MRRNIVQTASFGLLLLVGGCSDTQYNERLVGPSVAPELVASTDGKPTEQGAHDELIRIAAVALRDPDLRQRVRNDLQNLGVTREYKLHFGQYLQGSSGGVLLAAMAAGSNRTREDVLALLAGVRPLEFYMPVPEHRAIWARSGRVDPTC